jgi:hypothetical protein
MEENEIGENSILEIFPNPADAYVKVGALLPATNIGNADLIITDVIGNIVYAKSIQVDNGSVFETVNTEALASGMYFITLNSGDIFLSQQLIINK